MTGLFPEPCGDLARLLAEDLDIFGFTALGQRLGLTNPVIALDPALEIQITVDPVALGLFPGGNLGKGINAKPVQNTFQLGANSRDQFQIIRPGGLFDRCRTGIGLGGYRHLAR